MDDLITENRKYWAERAPGYSLVNQDELFGEQKDRWKSLLYFEITKTFPGRDVKDISILDIGCGPGFFSIILSELGFRVKAIDLTEEMIAEAKKNAGELSGYIDFAIMNAENLDIRDESFDVAISRNLTWNLPHPHQAYGEWCRVLKNGGLLLNFDANWYHYLFDEKKKEAFMDNRQELVSEGYEDYCECTDEDTMEAIAKRLPLGKLNRPDWDRQTLDSLGMRDIRVIWDIGKDIWSDEEKRNYALTPMFMIRAAKGKYIE